MWARISQSLQQYGQRYRSGGLAGVASSRLAANPVFFLGLWLIAPLLLSVILARQLEAWYGRPWGFAFIIFLVSAGLLIWGRRGIREALVRPGGWGDWQPHWGWSLVGLALALRYVLLDYLPPAHAIVEELQTGGIGAWSIANNSLTIDYRFTNWIAAVGFQIFGYSLEGMRSLFGLAGMVSILVMALTLRRLKAGWPATILTVFIMSSLPPLVLGGNTAEEIFGGIVFEMVLFYCVVCSFTSREYRLIWAGFAGIMAGALMYEYVPYKWVIVVPILTWLWVGLKAADREERRAALWAGSCYILCLTLVGAVVISDLLENRTNSYLLEVYLRHSHDRPFPLTDWEETKWAFGKMWDYVQILIGQSEIPVLYMWRLPGGGVVPGIAGIAFIAGFVYALWKPRILLLRIAALSLVAVIVLYGLTSNNLNVGILVPIFVLLVLLAGVAIDALTALIPGNVAVKGLVTLFLGGLIVGSNAVQVHGMSTHPGSLTEFQNNKWSVCRAISEEPHSYQQVHLAVGGEDCNYNQERWMFRDSEAPIVINYTLPAAGDIQPGTLVATGATHGLPPERIDALVRLAVDSGSSHTLRIIDTLRGDGVAAISFCYLCEVEE